MKIRTIRLPIGEALGLAHERVLDAGCACGRSLLRLTRCRQRVDVRPDRARALLDALVLMCTIHIRTHGGCPGSSGEWRSGNRYGGHRRRPQSFRRPGARRGTGMTGVVRARRLGTTERAWVGGRRSELRPGAAPGCSRSFLRAGKHGEPRAWPSRMDRSSSATSSARTDDHRWPARPRGAAASTVTDARRRASAKRTRRGDH